ncbi:MAG: hypothetical protein ACRDZO_18195 [Egibacteraceae bacterium]
MTKRKERLTVTVDPELVAAGNEAVAEGRAEFLSAWVNQALAERASSDGRLRALAEVVAAYEAEHGTITPGELAAQERIDREQAIVVRGRGAA